MVYDLRSLDIVVVLQLHSMYPYLLTIVADGIIFTTRHKTYVEALAMQLELEEQFGDMVSITLTFQEHLVNKGIIW